MANFSVVAFGFSLSHPASSSTFPFSQ